MKIEIIQETMIDVISSSVDNNCKTLEFKPGERLEIENFEENEDTWGFQFPNGMIAYFPTDVFKIIC